MFQIIDEAKDIRATSAAVLSWKEAETKFSLRRHIKNAIYIHLLRKVFQ